MMLELWAVFTGAWRGGDGCGGAACTVVVVRLRNTMPHSF